MPFLKKEKLKKDKTESVLHDESLKVWISIPPDLEEKVADGTGIIQQKAGVIRQKPGVNWQTYLDRKLISDEEFKFIKEFQETKNEEERNDFLKKYKGKAYTSITTIIRHLSSNGPYVEDIVKLLVLIDDMLWENFARLDEFNREEPEAWHTFQELLHSNDDLIQHLSSRIMIKLIRARKYKDPVPAERLKFFFGWLKEGLMKENEYLQSVARCFQVLLQVEEYRASFMKLNAVVKMIRLLSNGLKQQTQYQVCFCIWMTSFNPYLADKLIRFGTIPILVDVLESCATETVKVPRVILATFRNLLEKPNHETSRRSSALIMIQCKLPAYLDVLDTELHFVLSSDDTEFQEDFQAVQKSLQSYTSAMSSYDELLMELESGQLEWSVVHTCDSFWKQNADRLNENNHAMLRRLLQLMEDRLSDSTVVCIACHDVAQYMKHSAVGKRVMERIGGKEVLLKLLAQHRNVEVRNQALKSLQVLMLSNYEAFAHRVVGREYMRGLSGLPEFSNVFDDFED